MTTPYARGVAHERRTAARLRAHGYQVTRAAGSKGAFDLMAMRARERLLVSCKRDRHQVGPHEWHALWTAARLTDATPLIADMTGPRHTLRLWQLTDDRPTGSRVDEHLDPYHLWDPTALTHQP